MIFKERIASCSTRITLKVYVRECVIERVLTNVLTGCKEMCPSLLTIA
jgi:hypothetical protein